MRRLYAALRGYVHGRSRLFHAARALRFAAMVGPGRPHWVRYQRAFRRNVPIEAGPGTHFPDLDAGEAARQIEAEGFARGLVLPEPCADRLAEYFGPPNTVIKGNPHLDCRVAEEIARDPALIEVARRYLGVEPVLDSTCLWWSFPETPSGHAQRFHFDVADYLSLSVFFYLTDVDEDSGPHCLIRGTHRHKSLADCARIYLDDEEAERRYGDRIEMITGRKGTGFFEELTTFHKARPALRRRLIFAINYSMRQKMRGAAGALVAVGRRVRRAAPPVPNAAIR